MDIPMKLLWCEKDNEEDKRRAQWDNWEYIKVVEL